LFEVLGQDFSKKYLNEAMKNNKISHSYIINGPDGIGKSIFALHMAEVLLCNSEPSPCGFCNSCKKVEKLIHPDVKIIDNGKKSVGVNDIRNLIDEINTRPYEGKVKIIIIKNADNITHEGQNALLKTLEEPPNNVIIILLVEFIDSILQTILSRCQVLRFGRVPLKEIIEFLSKKGFTKEESEIATNLSDGIPGRALAQLDSKYVNLRKQTIEISHKIVTSDPLAGFECEKFFMDNKEDIDYIFDILMTWNRDILIFKSTKNEKNIINRDFYDLLVEESQLLSYNRLDRVMDVIKDTNEKIKQYANFQLAVEIMLLKFQEV
jgi:DNA polymerase III subunit delta'